MAMFSMIRKASSTVIPLALRTMSSSPRLLTLGPEEASFHSRQFSSVAVANKQFDKKFIQVLKSEIEPYRQNVPAKPDDFPFKIEENPDEKFIKLKSEEDHGETIEVSVSMPINDKYYSLTPYLQLNVKITKEDGMYIEIDLRASVDLIDLRVIKISIRNDRTCIDDPHEKLAPEVQHLLIKYLAIRGINKTNAEYLYKYMVQKPEFDNMMWLDELKKFLKK